MSTVRERLTHHLRVLVEDVGARPPGSPANERACDHAAEVLRSCGLEVVEHPFITRWWEPGDGRVETPDGALDAPPNPYSPACDVQGHVQRVERLAGLEVLEPDPARVLVLHGELTREQLLPAAFPFLDLPAHTRIRAALQRLRPAAVVSLSEHWQPILEDPDVGVPSTTLPPEAGAALVDGRRVRVRLGGAVHEGTGRTVAAHTGQRGARLVLSAHLDSKATTPGAFDNAASVAILLTLAEQGLEGLGPTELVLFNGEDHFDACGEVAWLTGTDLGEVVANLNLDGVGLTGQGTSVATLACPPGLEAAIDDWTAQRPGWVRAEPWIESDHAIFAMRGIPALAITSEDVHQLLGGLAHSPADTLEVLDLAVLEDVVRALPGLVTRVRDHLG